MPVKPAGDKYFSAIDKRIDIKGLSSTYLVNSGMPYPARYSVKDLIAVLSDVALIPSKGANAVGLYSSFR